MKKKIFVLCMISLFALSSCGSDDSVTPEPNQAPELLPTPQTPVPQAPAGNKWGAEYQNSTQACAKAGDAKYGDENQWRSYCGCLYATAATRWELEDFRINFNQRYNTLKAEGVVTKCLKGASII